MYQHCLVCGYTHSHKRDQPLHAETKACRTCGEVKQLDAFVRNVGSLDGHEHVCSDCQNPWVYEKATEPFGCPLCGRQIPIGESFVRHRYRQQSVMCRRCDHDWSH